VPKLWNSYHGQMVGYILRRCLSLEPPTHPVLTQPRALEMWQGFPRTSVVLLESHQVMMSRVQNMRSCCVRRRNAPLVVRSEGGKVTRQGPVLRTAHVLSINNNPPLLFIYSASLPLRLGLPFLVSGRKLGREQVCQGAGSELTTAHSQRGAPTLSFTSSTSSSILFSS
jgi:hypothetical protein